MTVIRHTWILLGVLLVLGVVDLVAHQGGALVQEELPVLPKLDPSAIQRIEVQEGDTTLVFEREGETWAITAPIEVAMAADRAAVRQMITVFHQAVPITVRLAETDHDAFGLGSAAARVRYLDADGREVSGFYVGKNASEGSTFLRLPDDAAVYRARLGGRQRWVRPLAAWRDHMVLGLVASDIEQVRLETTGGAPLVFRRQLEGTDDRGRPQLSPWTARSEQETGAESFRPDQASLDDLANSLATLRAGEILSPTHPAGLERPVAVAEVTLFDGSTRRLTFGATKGGAYASVEGRDAVYRVAKAIPQAAVRPLAAWIDRQLVDVPRTQMHQLILDDAIGRFVLEQDPSDSSWRMVEPSNIDVDLRQAMFTARTLSKLSADGMATLSLDEAGFPGAFAMEIVLRGEPARSVRLEFGGAVPGQAKGKEAIFVRSSTEPGRVAILSARTVSALRRAWAR